MRAALCAGVSLVAGLALGSGASGGQVSGRAARDSTGTIAGRLTNASTSQPITGVEVMIQGSGRSVRTDSGGRYLMRGIAAGRYHVLFRHPRFEPLEGDADLAAGDSLDITLAMQLAPVVLDTMRVRGLAPAPPMQGEFDRRRQTLHATFITRDELEQRASSNLADVIASKTPGVRLIHRVCGGMSCGWALASSKPASCLRMSGCPPVPLCYLAVWLDGQPIFLPPAEGGGSPPDLGQFRADDLGGVEVYAALAYIPPEFNMSGSACGVVALWTRTAIPKE